MDANMSGAGGRINITPSQARDSNINVLDSRFDHVSLRDGRGGESSCSKYIGCGDVCRTTLCPTVRKRIDEVFAHHQ